MNEELLQKLKVPPPQRDPNEFLMQEFARAMDLSPSSAKERLRKLVEEGVIVRKKVSYTNAAGVATTSWGYRYVGDKDGNR